MRSAVASPIMSSPQYNRFKYYSALKTGFEHLNPAEENTRATELFETPVHLIKSEQFLFLNPFQSNNDQGKPNMMTTLGRAM